MRSKPSSTCSRRALLAALLAMPLARAQQIDVIELRHRSAEQVLPLLQPLVEPGGALTGQGYRLFLRTSAANRRQLRDLLDRLDVPLRQLLLTVSQDRADERTTEQRAADGSLTIGSRGVGGSAAAAAGNARHWSTRRAVQQIRVIEGAPAYVEMGTAVALAFRQWVVTTQGRTELRGTVYYDALTGFHARANVAGDEVTLELTPELSALPADGGSARLSTTARGRLGEWIAVGGADVRGEAAADGARNSEATRYGVWMKVEEVAR